MVSGEWSVVTGHWSLVHGHRSLVTGQCASFMETMPVDHIEGSGTSEHSGEPRRRRRRRGHRRRQQHREKQKHAMVRMGYFAAGCGFAALAVILNLHDTSLRRPGTDDGPGDPPTFFLLLAIVAAVIAGFCLLRLVMLIRSRADRV